MDQVLLLEVIGSLGVIAVMLILLVRLSRILLGPIDQVVATATRIADGRTGERLDPDRPETELGRMAVAFDEMLDSLEAAIRESQASEAEAREAEARSNQFLADAAHQLRTPVAGLRASVDSLMRTTDPDDQQRLLDNLAGETARTSRLVGSLLRVAQLDRGDAFVTLPTDLCEIAISEVHRARTYAPTLEIRLEMEEMSLIGDVEPDSIAEAISNLLDNARRHAAGIVDVKVIGRGPWILVSVEDDGPGVPMELRDRIFDRFTTFDTPGGSGLGLPIARSIARAHGGDLTFTGEVFVLRIPRSPVSSETEDGARDQRRPATLR